ncbi:hypothetical protein ACFQH2_17490 [Natronoarchaeum sp. GCM10025703]|uniref:hypothetical protein n=1 Tax=Natronoarchaeum sp. GCM10025321 TaxID=3252684 RepID=UPI0036097C80
MTAQVDGEWVIDDEGKPARDAFWYDEHASDSIGERQESDINNRLYDVCVRGQFLGTSLALLQWLREHETETIMAADIVFL